MRFGVAAGSTQEPATPKALQGAVVNRLAILALAALPLMGPVDTEMNRGQRGLTASGGNHDDLVTPCLAADWVACLNRVGR